MMSNSILNAVMNRLTPQATTALARQTGVPSSSVHAGIRAGVSALLKEGFTRSADSELMVRLFYMARNLSGTNFLDTLHFSPNPGAASATEQGSQIAASLLGDRQSVIEEEIADQAGIPLQASQKLLAVAAPLTLGVLGQKIQDQSLSLFSFSQFIGSEASKKDPQSAHISATPLPLSDPLTSSLAAGRRSTGRRGLLLALCLLALGWTTWLMVQGCNRQEATSAPPAQPTAAVPASTPAPGPLGEFIDRKLPDGTVLHIPRLGVENRLIDFIKDSSKPVDKTTWFDFDRLTFDTGAATLQSSSSEQLQNVAAIFKAYPNVKAKIGGYTDNTGKQSTNLKLSQDRAQNVMEALITRGTAASRLEAKGYGEEYPVADNSTEEGRQKNRRISLLVTAK